MRYGKFIIVLAVLILGCLLAFQLSTAGQGQGKGPKNEEKDILQEFVDYQEVILEWGIVYSEEIQAPVPKTGQTESYYPGDDGDLQMGISCPEPRFTDNRDGETVIDNCTGLVWLKNANCLATNHPEFDNDDIAGDGQVTWQHALDFVAGINNQTYGDCGAGYTDWRLPNIKELLSLVDLGFSDPAIADTSPFTNVVSFYYWSSSSSIDPVPGYERWFVLFLNGSAHGYDEAFPALVWPVRGGN